METFTMLCGFAGAWLLVAGPVYQAALELQEETFERDHLRDVRQQIGDRPRISAWWWLLPPVKLLLERRLNDQYHQDFIAALPDEDVAALLSYMNKASGWVLVSGGGLLLAIKETYELVLTLGWDHLLVLPIALLLAFACVANTAVRISRSKHITGSKSGSQPAD